MSSEGQKGDKPTFGEAHARLLAELKANEAEGGKGANNGSLAGTEADKEKLRKVLALSKDSLNFYRCDDYRDRESGLNMNLAALTLQDRELFLEFKNRMRDLVKDKDNFYHSLVTYGFNNKNLITEMISCLKKRDYHDLFSRMFRIGLLGSDLFEYYHAAAKLLEIDDYEKALSGDSPTNPESVEGLKAILARERADSLKREEDLAARLLKVEKENDILQNSLDALRPKQKRWVRVLRKILSLGIAD